MAELHRGIVKWFNDAKGFGFIEHETGRDVFVHYSVIETEGFKTLKDGEEVEYELREGDKGLNAARVVRKNPPPSVKKTAPRQTRIEAGSIRGVASLIEVETINERDSELDEPLVERLPNTDKILEQ
jgi:cold shock protein